MFVVALLPEFLIFILFLIQLLIMSFSSAPLGNRVFFMISYLGLGLAFLAAIYIFDLPSADFLNHAIKTEPIFNPIRMIFILITGFLLHMIYNYKDVSGTRKMESGFFIVSICFYALVLLQSNHLLISFLSLLGIGLLSCLLVASPFKSGTEGKAAFRFFYIMSCLFLVGFGTLVFLTVVIGKLNFEEVKQYFVHQEQIAVYPIILFIILPSLVISGLFPLQFAVIDEEHGATWTLQACLTVLVQGAGVISIIKTLMSLFYYTSSSETFITSTIMIIGIIGAFVGGLGAFTQTNSKRFIAYFSLAQWSICLLPLARPSPLAVSASLFHFISVAIGLLLFFWVLTIYHGYLRQESLQSLQGLGKKIKWESVLLAFVLGSFSFLPPFMGFPAFLNILGALFEQRAIGVIILSLCLPLVLWASIWKILSSLFFEGELMRGANNSNADIIVSSGKMQKFAMLTLLFPLIALGIYWEPLLSNLLHAANSFIIQ